MGFLPIILLLPIISLSVNHDMSGSFLLDAYLKSSYKVKINILIEVDNYMVLTLPGQKNLAQD